MCAVALVLPVLSSACSVLPAPMPPPTPTAPPTPTPTATPIPPATREAVVKFVSDLRMLDAETEIWWRDFNTYMERATTTKQSPSLGEFDGLSSRYDILLDRVRKLNTPNDPVAREVSLRWVTAYLKTLDLLRGLREAVASRQGDPAKLQALDDASVEAGKQADDAMQALVNKYQLKPQEIAQPTPQAKP